MTDTSKRPPATFWRTAERVAALKAGVAQGQSAADIARTISEQFGERVSRNTVSSKASRMGLRLHGPPAPWVRKRHAAASSSAPSASKLADSAKSAFGANRTR